MNGGYSVEGDHWSLDCLDRLQELHHDCSRDLSKDTTPLYTYYIF